MRRALSLLLLATAVVGCQSKTPEPAKVPLGQAPAAAPATGDDLTGPVLEQLNAPPYIYLRIKTSKVRSGPPFPGPRSRTGPS